VVATGASREEELRKRLEAKATISAEIRLPSGEAREG
jgi:hypothetical protein